MKKLTLLATLIGLAISTSATAHTVWLREEAATPDLPR